MAKVIRVQLSNGKVDTLFEGANPAFIPNSQTLVYAKVSSPGVFARSMIGDASRNHEERLVADYVVPIGGFVPVANGLVYSGSSPDGRRRAFRFFNSTTRRTTDIAPVPPHLVIGLDVSLDHRLFFAAGADGGEDLLLFDFGTRASAALSIFSILCAHGGLA